MKEREILAEDDELVVALRIENGSILLELTSSEMGPDLSAEDEVVVVANGEPLAVDVEGPHLAQAVLVEDLDEQVEPMSLMVRVFEFFEGWELFVDDEG